MTTTIIPPKVEMPNIQNPPAKQNPNLKQPLIDAWNKVNQAAVSFLQNQAAFFDAITALDKSVEMYLKATHNKKAYGADDIFQTYDDLKKEVLPITLSKETQDAMLAAIYAFQDFSGKSRQFYSQAVMQTIDDNFDLGKGCYAQANTINNFMSHNQVDLNALPDEALIEQQYAVLAKYYLAKINNPIKNKIEHDILFLSEMENPKAPPGKSGHTVYQVDFKTPEQKQTNGFYKENKHGDPLFSKMEVAFTAAQKHYLQELTADAWLVHQDGSEKIAGLVVEGIPGFRSFKKISEDSSLKDTISKDEQYKQDLAKILITSLFTEEDDAHKDNLAVANVNGAMRVVKIDHDMSFYREISSHLKSGQRLYHAIDNRFKLTAADLDDFPDVRSNPHYWVTKHRLLTKDGKGYTREETKFFKSLGQDATFKRAKWNALIELVLSDNNELREKIIKQTGSPEIAAQIVQATQHKQAVFKSLMLSNENFRAHMNSITGDDIAQLNVSRDQFNQFHLDMIVSGQANDSALHAAIRHDNFRYNETLNDHRDQLNIKNGEGDTPLAVAINSNKTKTIDYFLKNEKNHIRDNRKYLLVISAEARNFDAYAAIYKEAYSGKPVPTAFLDWLNQQDDKQDIVVNHPVLLAKLTHDYQKKPQRFENFQTNFWQSLSEKKDVPLASQWLLMQVNPEQKIQQPEDLQEFSQAYSTYQQATKSLSSFAKKPLDISFPELNNDDKTKDLKTVLLHSPNEVLLHGVLVSNQAEDNPEKLIKALEQSLIEIRDDLNLTLAEKKLKAMRAFQAAVPNIDKSDKASIQKVADLLKDERFNFITQLHSSFWMIRRIRASHGVSRTFAAIAHVINEHSPKTIIKYKNRMLYGLIAKQKLDRDVSHFDNLHFHQDAYTPVNESENDLLNAKEAYVDLSEYAELNQSEALVKKTPTEKMKEEIHHLKFLHYIKKHPYISAGSAIAGGVALPFALKGAAVALTAKALLALAGGASGFAATSKFSDIRQRFFHHKKIEDNERAIVPSIKR